MDYDDNDFQSQNFHLAGEENSKFPPGLRSYALPKFDLDDSLQVHLTFDSLVETEVLLGIQSQEENRWIEFSRGSSDIDFSSSAPESCSISRPNNVWSEATSSESVEMLLNSVGQDEMITEQTIIEESDVFDELGNLTNQMEPSLKQHGSILSIIGDVVDSGPTLSSEKCLERFSGLNEDAGVELPHVGATSQTHEGEKYGNEISRDRDLDPSSVSEKCGLPMTEGSLLIDGKCTDANKREGGPSVDRSLDNRTRNNSTTSVQVDHSASVQGIIASVGDLNNQGAPQLVTDLAYENTDGLRNDDDENGVEHQVLNKETQMDVRNCEGNAIETNIKNVENPFIMKMDSNVQILEGNVVETSINIVEDPFSLALTTDPTVVDIAEGCSKDACFVNTVPISECEVMVLSKDIEMGDLLIGNTHETSLVVEGNNGFEGHAGEISNSNAGMGSGLEMKMDSVAQITHGQNNFVSLEKQEDILETDFHQLERGASVSNSEMSLLTVEDNKLFGGQCDRSSNSHVRDLSGLTVEVCSSGNLFREAQAIENIKDGNDGLGVHVEIFNGKDHISSCVQVESTQACNRNVVGQSDIHASQPNVSVVEKGNAWLPTDSGDIDCDIDGRLIIEKRAASSSLGHSAAEIEVVAHETSYFEKLEGILETDFHQLERGVSVSNPEKSLLTMEDKKLFGGQCDGSSNSHVEDLSGLTVEVCSSGSLLRERQAIENVKDGHNGLGIQVEIFNAKDHISSCVQAESTQACKRNVVGQSDIHDSQPDVSVVEKGNACLPTDSGNMDCDIDGCLIIEKRAASSSLGHSAAEIEVVAHESSSYQIFRDVLEDTNLASCDTLDGVHNLLSAKDGATDEGTEHKQGGKSPLLVGDFTLPDEKEETVTKISTEPSSLDLKDYSHMESESVPVSEDQGTICDNARQLLCETVGQSSSPMETDNITCQDEPRAAVENKATQEHSIDLEMCSVRHDSKMKENDAEVVELVALGNHEVTSLSVAGDCTDKKRFAGNYLRLNSFEVSRDFLKYLIPKSIPSSLTKFYSPK